MTGDAGGEKESDPNRAESPAESPRARGQKGSMRIKRHKNAKNEDDPEVSVLSPEPLSLVF